MPRCLFIHAGAIGDFVLSLRVIATLRRSGFGHVTFLGRPHIAEIAPPPEGADAVLDLEAGGFHTLFSADAEIPAPIRSRLAGFDLAIDMVGSLASPLAARLRQLGIPRTVGVDPRPRPDWRGHVSDQWLADLRAAGLDTCPDPPRIAIDAAALSSARSRLRAAVCSAPVTAARSSACGVLTPPAIAILHPGSGGHAKCWPLPNFIDLANRLRRIGWRPLFLIGPVERERLASDELAAMSSAAPLVEEASLRQVAALVASAGLFIGNDSGVSHLAAAVRTPTIAVFGPSDPARYCPLGDHVAVVRAARADTWPSVADIPCPSAC